MNRGRKQSGKLDKRRLRLSRALGNFGPSFALAARMFGKDFQV